MKFADEDVFNAELTYIADNIRRLVESCNDAQGVLKRTGDPADALRYQVCINQLLVGLIYTGRYKKKEINTISADLGGIAWKDKKEFHKLYEIEERVAWEVADKNLFQKIKRKVDKV